MRESIVYTLFLIVSSSLFAFDLPNNLNYQKIKQEAIVLAGRVEDIENRVDIFKQMFLASEKQFEFPLIAAHGALWLESFRTKSGFLFSSLLFSIICG